MNRDDEFIAQLEDYLDTHEGVVPLPDAVRDTVHARLPRTRQARPARPGRMLHMTARGSTPMRRGAVAAVLVAAVAMGAVFVSTRGGMPVVGSAQATPPPPPSPSPSPGVQSTPSPEPSVPTALRNARMVPCPVAGGVPTCLEAGAYGLSADAWPALISLEVPEGWFEWRPGDDLDAVLVEAGPPAVPDGSGWGIYFMVVDAVSKDPCDPAKGTFAASETDTVEGLVAAMSEWPEFTTTSSSPIEMDGYSGRLLELTSTRTETDCPASVMWRTPLDHIVEAYPIDGEDPGYTLQLRLLDVNGTVLGIATTDFPQTSPFELGQGVPMAPDRHAADQRELAAILDSVRIRAESP